MPVNCVFNGCIVGAEMQNLTFPMFPMGGSLLHHVEVENVIPSDGYLRLHMAREINFSHI